MTFHCFSCGLHGDIFELVGKIEGIEDKAETFQRVYEILNLQAENNRKQNPARTNARPSKELPFFDDDDYTAYYKQCHARANETEYFSFRGIDIATNVSGMGLE
jgi:DNA primase